MKLTPSAQGFRVRKPYWPNGCFLDIKQVGKVEDGWRKCRAISESGKAVELLVDEADSSWARISGTTPKKHRS